MSNQQSTQAVEDYDVLLFHVDVSVRYHDRRRRHYETLQQVSLFLGILIASGAVRAFVEWVSQDWLTYLIPLVGTTLLSLAIVLRASSKSNDHSGLKRDFISLLEDMERHRENADSDRVAVWRARRLAIEADEPPVNRIVHALSYNELVKSKPVAQLPSKRYVVIKWYHWAFGWATRAFDSTLKLGPEQPERY